MAKDDIVYTARVDFEQAKRALDSANQKFKKAGVGTKKYQTQLRNVIKAEGEFSTAQKKMDRSLGKVSKSFDVSALGVMFFGMALQRVFKSISKASISTFRQVVQSTEGGFTAFEELNGQVKFLQFTLGQALEPFVALLIPIVAKVADWVSRNDKLVASLLLVLGAIGSILFLFGTLKLGITSIVSASSLLGSTFSAAFSAIAGIVTAVGLPVIAAIVAAVVALYLAWKTNFAGIREFVDTTFKNVKKAFDKIWKGIKQVFSGIMKFLEGVFTGDFDKMWAGIVDIFKGAWKVMSTVVKTAVVSMLNVVIFLINAITSTFFNSIKIFLGWIKKVIELVNRIPGINIGTGGIDKAMDKLDSIKKKTQMDYKTTDDLFGAEQAVEQTNQANISVVNNIQLDGEDIAKTTSTRISDQFSRYA